MNSQEKQMHKENLNKIREELKKAKETEKELREEIKAENQKNRPIKKIRHKRKSIELGKYLAPYALSALMAGGAMATVKHSPFELDSKPRVLYTKDTIDSLKNSTHEEQETIFKNPNGTITITGKWELQEDGSYKRETNTYSTNGIDIETINQLPMIMNTLPLEDIFGKSISSKREVKQSLTEEELSSPPFFEGTLYSTTISGETLQTKDDNIGDVLIFMSLWGIAGCCVAIYRLKKSPFLFNKIKEEFFEIERQYPYTYDSTLHAKYECTKSEVETLTRKLKQ